MSHLDSYDLMQNAALGSCCISQFVQSYYDVAGRKAPFPLLMAVLPIVFHERTVNILHRRSFEAGLLNAKTEFRDLGLGLQTRMEEMFEQSMTAVRFGVQLGLFKLDSETCEFEPLKKLPREKFPLSTKRMLSTSDRLGYWMGKGPLEIVCSHLNILF